MLIVAARDHPLAQCQGIIPKSELSKHVQLVLTDRSSLSEGVISPSTSRLSGREVSIPRCVGRTNAYRYNH